jgi:sialic acid synthase SpsE
VELGVTTVGTLSRALELIDAASAAGVDACKFILTDPDKIMASKDRLYTYETLAIAGMSEDGANRIYEVRKATRPIYDLLKETMFTPDEWRTIQARCAQKGLIFYATTDYLEGVDFLESLNVPAHKVCAWDIAFTPLIDKVRATGKPVLVDVGTATREEVQRAIPDEQNIMFVHAPHPFYRLDWNMSRLVGLFRPDYAVGFSSPGRETWCDFMALGGGACLIEKRLTLRRDDPAGHHHANALEPDELRQWVKDMHDADLARREAPFDGTIAAWQEREKYDRNADGLRP